MTPPLTADPRRFRGQIDADRRENDLFRDLYQDTSDEDRSIAGLRRRRRRATNEIGSVMKTVSLVEDNGTLYWRDGVPARTPSRRRAPGTARVG